MKTLFAAVSLAAALLASPVFADRIILAPSGNVLGTGGLNLEAAFDFSGDGNIYWAGVGIKQLEINVVRFDDGVNVVGANDATVVGAELNVMPETMFTPGVGVGVWDITSETSDGIGYYAMLSKMVPLTNTLPLPISNIKLHLGYGLSGVSGLIAGAEADVPFGLNLAAEYFKDDFNFAISKGILPGLRARLYSIDGDVFYGLQFRPQF